MEKGAAGCPSPPSHYGLTNPGISRNLASRPPNFMRSRPMPDRVIENPVLNSPFIEPGRHFRFDDDGITNEVVSGQRTSSYFVPIPPPKRKGKERLFETEWTKEGVSDE
jgi:hypothetical protein